MRLCRLGGSAARNGSFSAEEIPIGPGRSFPRRPTAWVPERCFTTGRRGRREWPAGAGEWITRADNPLTARVIANRVWQHHFGRGIVSTPSNFGVRGEQPTHPELLDWLAARLVASGWSIKDLHRQILLSRDLPALRASPTSGTPPLTPGTAGSGGSTAAGSTPSRFAMPCWQSRASSITAGPAAPVSRDRGLALDPARRVQGGLSESTSAAYS